MVLYFRERRSIYMPLSYTDILESFPPEFRLPLSRLIDTFHEELKEVRATRSDLEDVKAIIRDLVAAQKRSEAAQERSEERLTRLEKAVAELVEAQKRTEKAIEELAQAQKRTDHQLAAFRREFAAQIGGLGARWGMQTEESFRQGMRAILQEVGFTTEQFREYDAAGEVFGDPDQVELDVIIKNGKLIAVEIKSSVTRQDTRLFNRKAAFYARKTGRRVDRKMIVTPYAEDRAKDMAREMGIEIYTDVNDVA
jgi:hypothetical protein